jgi:predicted nucleic acid-binding protein
MAEVVVDASAVVSFLTSRTDLDDEVIAIFRTAKLLAPALLPFEVASALRRFLLSGVLTPEMVERDLTVLEDLAVDYVPWFPLANRAMGLAMNVSSFDASYVALAELTGATLLTRDAHLARAPDLRCEVLVF